MVLKHRPLGIRGKLAWAADGDAFRLLDTVVRPAWHADAACREHPELNWVAQDDVPSGSKRYIAPAKAICGTCLVRPECLATALADSSLVGIWGGTTTRERVAIRRRLRRRP